MVPPLPWPHIMTLGCLRLNRAATGAQHARYSSVLQMRALSRPGRPRTSTCVATLRSRARPRASVAAAAAAAATTATSGARRAAAAAALARSASLVATPLAPRCAAALSPATLRRVPRGGRVSKKMQMAAFILECMCGAARRSGGCRCRGRRATWSAAWAAVVWFGCLSAERLSSPFHTMLGAASRAAGRRLARPPARRPARGASAAAQAGGVAVDPWELHAHAARRKAAGEEILLLGRCAPLRLRPLSAPHSHHTAPGMPCA